jgi:hypothetical protein
VLLREAVTRHIRSGQEPRLSLCQKPTGAWDWNSNLESLGIDGQVEGVDIYLEGPDETLSQDEFVENIMDES